jgi:hypothetical protein
MDYFLIAMAGFLFGIYIQTLKHRDRPPPRRKSRPGDAAERQLRAFLRGMEAFEKGVAGQLERDRAAARIRAARRPRIS